MGEMTKMIMKDRILGEVTLDKLNPSKKVRKPKTQFLIEKTKNLLEIYIRASYV